MSDPFKEVVEALASASQPVCVTAAAGCGKTEAIVQAVILAKGRQLILTHTNAGVAALRSRLRRYSVPESKYRVETIASWLLKYATAYPSMSSFTNRRPKREEWNEVYPATLRLFSNHPFINNVLQASYSGAFVDEYQDCTQQQHKVVLELCKYLPVRVLGDPLQGIFGFQKDAPAVNWQADVVCNFKALLDLDFPYRWQKTARNPNANPVLGQQLVIIRANLSNYESVDLESYPEIKWVQWSQEQEKNVCDGFTRTGDIVGIHASKKGEYLDHGTAKRLAGTFQCIEEMDCSTLMFRAKSLDGCLSKNNFKCIRWNLEQFILEGVSDERIQNSEMIGALSRLESSGVDFIPELMDIALRTLPVHRRELLTEMKRAAQEYNRGLYKSFEEAAYAARYKTRVSGRKIEKRTISRTMLIKGLEFEHAIVLNADELPDRENFYVAVTRGSQSLTILSSSPIIHFAHSI